MSIDDPPSRRGVSYWAGNSDTAARIYVTSGSQLIGLSAFTGEPTANFGDGGIVDMSKHTTAYPLYLKTCCSWGPTAFQVPSAP